MAKKSKERLELEAKAEGLGLKFSSNIGDEKLMERVQVAELEKTAVKDAAEAAEPDGETPAEQDVEPETPEPETPPTLKGDVLKVSKERRALEDKAADLGILDVATKQDDVLALMVGVAELKAEVNPLQPVFPEPMSIELFERVTCKTLERVRYNGTLYSVGEPIELDPATFDELKALGVVTAS
ncbi:MAG: hypothetical protein ACRBB0_25650 [Pelagimonas sp.]|uniref:hypothetical protein n=1 Tax=Pelagimonas sp. TaxID=2073170 RepID=UPI003D6AECB9